MSRLGEASRTMRRWRLGAWGGRAARTTPLGYCGEVGDGVGGGGCV